LGRHKAELAHGDGVPSSALGLRGSSQSNSDWGARRGEAGGFGDNRQVVSTLRAMVASTTRAPFKEMDANAYLEAARAADAHIIAHATIDIALIRASPVSFL
jgi:homoserine acetyltransferase